MRLITQIGIAVTVAGVAIGAVTGEPAGNYVALLAALFTVIEYLASPRPPEKVTPPLVHLGPEPTPAPAPVQAEAAPVKPKRTRKPKAEKPVAKPAAKPAAMSATKKPAAPKAIAKRTTKK